MQTSEFVSFYTDKMVNENMEYGAIRKELNRNTYLTKSKRKEY